jgi:predicted anti-sigma-YlaC factor YlaD
MTTMTPNASTDFLADMHQGDVPQIDAATVETLYSLMDSLAQCYESHRQILLRKREILVKAMAAKDRMTELQATDRTLLSLNQRAGQLDRERRRLQTSMGCGDWTLTQVIVALQDGFTPMARKLTALRDRLQVAMQESGRLNVEIKGLLELSLGWIRETVELISSACTPEGASYSAPGIRRAEETAPPMGLRSTISHSA